MNYARREERIPRGILSGSLLSAVIAAAYRDLVVHTPALVPSPTYKFYDIPPWSRDVSLTREKITIIFLAIFNRRKCALYTRWENTPMLEGSVDVEVLVFSSFFIIIECAKRKIPYEQFIVLN